MRRQISPAVYPQRMRPSRYDEAHFLVYLNESPAEYFPDEDSETPSEGFAYTGELEDGGTLIVCDEMERNKLINGLIRKKYMQTEEDAIKTHYLKVLAAKTGIDELSDEKIAEYQAEWDAFEKYRLEAISLVDKWLEE